MENLNVRVDSINGNTLTVLEGAALEQKHPEKIKLFGNIESVKQFLDKRYTGGKGKSLQEVDREKAVVMVDKQSLIIKLLLDPENFFGSEVLASLEFTEELKAFQINSNHQFTRESMIKLLKFNKRFFENPMKHEELLESYMKLNLSGSTQVKNESDDRGMKDLAFKKTINSQNIPLGFVLEMPIFKGQAVEKFRVDICLDVTDASVRFWFESVELVELTEMRKDEIFSKQLESCQDFVIIHK